MGSDSDLESIGLSDVEGDLLGDEESDGSGSAAGDEGDNDVLKKQPEQPKVNSMASRMAAARAAKAAIRDVKLQKAMEDAAKAKELEQQRNAEEERVRKSLETDEKRAEPGQGRNAETLTRKVSTPSKQETGGTQKQSAVVEVEESEAESSDSSSSESSSEDEEKEDVVVVPPSSPEGARKRKSVPRRRPSTASKGLASAGQESGPNDNRNDDVPLMNLAIQRHEAAALLKRANVPGKVTKKAEKATRQEPEPILNAKPNDESGKASSKQMKKPRAPTGSRRGPSKPGQTEKLKEAVEEGKIEKPSRKGAERTKPQSKTGDRDSVSMRTTRPNSESVTGIGSAVAKRQIESAKLTSSPRRSTRKRKQGVTMERNKMGQWKARKAVKLDSLVGLGTEGAIDSTKAGSTANVMAAEAGEDQGFTFTAEARVGWGSSAALRPTETRHLDAMQIAARSDAEDRTPAILTGAGKLTDGDAQETDEAVKPSAYERGAQREVRRYSQTQAADADVSQRPEPGLDGHRDRDGGKGENVTEAKKKSERSFLTSTLEQCRLQALPRGDDKSSYRDEPGRRDFGVNGTNTRDQVQRGDQVPSHRPSQSHVVVIPKGRSDDIPGPRDDAETGRTRARGPLFGPISVDPTSQRLSEHLPESPLPVMTDRDEPFQAMIFCQQLQRSFWDFADAQDNMIDGFLSLVRRRTSISRSKSAHELPQAWASAEERQYLRRRKWYAAVNSARLELRRIQEQALEDFAKKVSAAREVHVSALGDFIMGSLALGTGTSAAKYDGTPRGEAVFSMPAGAGEQAPNRLVYSSEPRGAGDQFMAGSLTPLDKRGTTAVMKGERRGLDSALSVENRGLPVMDGRGVALHGAAPHLRASEANVAENPPSTSGRAARFPSHSPATPMSQSAAQVAEANPEAGTGSKRARVEDDVSQDVRAAELANGMLMAAANGTGPVPSVVDVNGAIPGRSAKTAKAGATDVQLQSQTFEDNDSVENWVGEAFAETGMDYRARAILKMCNRVGGVSDKMLYDMFPFGKNTLNKRLDMLTSKCYLYKTEISDSKRGTGKPFYVYTTVETPISG